MRPNLMRSILGLAAGAALLPAIAAAQTEIRVGWCTPVIDISAGAPFAAAMEHGWFAENGVSVTLIPMGGSTDCVLNVMTGQVDTAVAAPEAVAIMASRGGDLSVFYTAMGRNMFGVAVPADSPIQSYEDLAGARIGVASMGSVGVVIARSVLQSRGLNPDSDVSIVVSGSPIQARALLESGEIAALSYWDMVYSALGAMGLEMRKLDDPATGDFPSNGFVARREALDSPERAAALAAVARGYAMGSIYADAHPEEAAQIYFRHFPQTRAQGLTLEEDIAAVLPVLAAATQLWGPRPGSEQRGVGDVAQYQAYIDWLQGRGVLEGAVTAEQIVDNSLQEAIQDFDPALAANPN